MQLHGASCFAQCARISALVVIQLKAQIEVVAVDARMIFLLVDDFD